MAQTPAPEQAPGVYLDLSALPPTPGRLVEILDLVAGCGYGRVAVDWGSSFPWSLDERFKAGYAYPEEVVAAIARQSAGARVELIPVVPAPDAMEFIYRLSGYRHLFRPGEAGLELDLAVEGGAKLYRDLAEDLLELLPGSRSIAFAPAALLGSSAERWVGELAEHGVQVRPLVAGAQEAAAAEAFSVRKRVETLFVCDGRTEPDRSAGGHPAPSLLFSFQPTRGSPLLRRPIELSLGAVVERAPVRGAADPIGNSGRQGREAVDRLELLASGAWEEIRMIREGVALAALSDEAETGSLEMRLGRLQDAVAAGRRSSEELLVLLKKMIEPAPLKDALASLVEPLEEELHLLIPRVHLLGRRSRHL